MLIIFLFFWTNVIAKYFCIAILVSNTKVISKIGLETNSLVKIFDPQEFNFLIVLYSHGISFVQDCIYIQYHARR